jgi:hypothetical protein
MRHRLLVLLLCAGPAVAATEVYRWVDANGVVHYSATEPAPALNAQRVRVSGLAVEGGDGEAAASAPAAEAANAGGTRADAANAETNCTSARAQLELLQSNAPVGLANAGANAKPIDAKERQAQIAHAQAQIATYCK